jgi:hypothetical protein
MKNRKTKYITEILHLAPMVVLKRNSGKELAIIADYMTKSIKTSERITENLRDKVNLAKPLLMR